MDSFGRRKNRILPVGQEVGCWRTRFMYVFLPLANAIVNRADPQHGLFVPVSSVL